MQSKQDKMELIIKEQKRNPLLLREEVKAVSSNGITPKAEGLKIKLAEKFNKKPEFVVIKSIKGKFGRRDFDIIAYCYDDESALKRVEPKPKEKKAQAEVKDEGKEKKQ